MSGNYRLLQVLKFRLSVATILDRVLAKRGGGDSHLKKKGVAPFRGLKKQICVQRSTAEAFVVHFRILRRKGK